MSNTPNMPNTPDYNDKSHLNGNGLNSAADLECAAFQEDLPNRITSGEDLSSHPHMLTCPRCPTLVGDLQYIAEFAKKLLPIDPPDELWAKINKAIEHGDA